MTRFQTSLLLLALAGPAAFAQDEVRRTGIIGAEPPPRRLITNANELDLLKLLPDGYAYTFHGEIKGKSYVVSRMKLVSPDQKTQLALVRIDGVYGVRRRALPSGKLVLKHGGADLHVERNRATKLDRYLDETVHSGGPGNFEVRGWRITKTESGVTKRSVLLDAIDVKVKRLGLEHVWAERVYDKGQTVLLQALRSVQTSVKRKHVEVARYDVPTIFIPPFAGSADYGRVRRTGVLGSRRPPTVIKNCSELQSLKIFRDGYAYTFDGGIEKKVPRGASRRGFIVHQIALESPNGKKTLSLRRFEMRTASVRKTTGPKGRLMITYKGFEHQIEKNPFLKLDRYLDETIQAQDPGRFNGTFKVRGWVITRTNGKSKTYSALLDGIEVKVAREGLDRVWAERVYNKGKTVLIEPTGSVQLGIKRRFVEVLRKPPARA